MTRETKIGVAVACSFLGLVAAVVVLRMGNVSGPASTGNSAEQLATANVPGPVEKGQETGIQPALFQSGSLLPVPDTKPATPAAPSERAKDILGGIPVPPSIPSPPAIPSGPPVPAPTRSQAPDPAAPITPPPSATMNVPPVPAPADLANNQTKNGIKPPTTASGDISMPPLPGSAAPVAAQEIKSPPKEEKQNKIEDELRKQLAASKQPAPSPVSQAAVAPPAPAPGVPTVAVAQTKDSTPLPVAAPAPVPEAKALADVPNAPARPGPDVPALPPAPSPIGKEEKAPPAPVPSLPEATSKGPLAASEPQPAPSPPLNKAAPAPPAVALGPKAPDSPLGEHSGQPDMAKEAQAPRSPGDSIAPPPVGALPGGISVPIAVPIPPAAAAAAAPRVQSYDTEMHTCKGGESTFADLSKSLYKSDKYAQALLQFNRENPLVGDSFRDPSPTLKPGQQVVVPPAWVLEQPRYATPPPQPHANPAPAPAPVAAAPAPVTPPSPPLAAGRPAPAPAKNNPAPKNASQAGTPTYTVRGNGQMLFEIAKETLGDGKRWAEIYRLNPEIRPELAIPGGTQLRLPTDAHVGS